ncbi:hypothetical protein BU17DRAFT_93563 [Hysterangium stoloniferum]|nr:hypothetical protein BU17DRAFT_93563 [Hysterangium stoloniferum]
MSSNVGVIHHSSYYFSNPATFLVEDKLFRVPTYKFKTTSPSFRAMLSLHPEGDESEGQTASDAKPVRLDQVSLVDFERLLKFLYPFGDPRTTLGLEEWDSIFSLAKEWEMENVRVCAVETLDSFDMYDSHPEYQVCYGRKYDHDPWVYKGLKSLLIRLEGLTEKEGEMLGIKDTIRCARARELYWNSHW